jgi:molybdopterin/thiamine biosynthesis adenylyltransferase
MLNPKLEDIIEAARLHYENSLSDIENASTRIEHLRLSALAEEAKLILDMLTNFALVSAYRPLPGSFGPTH